MLTFVGTVLGLLFVTLVALYFVAVIVGTLVVAGKEVVETVGHGMVAMRLYESWREDRRKRKGRLENAERLRRGLPPYSLDDPEALPPSDPPGGSGVPSQPALATTDATGGMTMAITVIPAAIPTEKVRTQTQAATMRVRQTPISTKYLRWRDAADGLPRDGRDGPPGDGATGR